LTNRDLAVELLDDRGMIFAAGPAGSGVAPIRSFPPVILDRLPISETRSRFMRLKCSAEGLKIIRRTLADDGSENKKRKL